MNSLNLSDYTDCPEKLVGRLVLLTIGSTNLGQNRKLTSVLKASKGQIILASESDTKYNWNGEAKGSGVGRQNWGIRNSFELITDEQAQELTIEWRKKRQTKEMKKAIAESLDKIDFETLKGICKALNIEVK